MSAVKRNEHRQFAKGWRGGPGRPPGKRNYLTETVLQALGADFELHGAAVIEDVRKTKPSVYLQCCVSLLPKQMQRLDDSPFSELTDAEVEQLEQLLAAIRARTVKALDRHNGADDEPSADIPSAIPAPEVR
jgi:hypothetical protein